ncbi:type II toxin-antitoxin system VapC family toxin [Nocardioides sp. KC13]|uniref:Ribonuclease VapC n=1 Tax=Nocardioides turkmenicus TaxID=2711220 RepID=A0A6M1QW65_9ACTN|nr:type II toxin-antitoxin system VapC family toxin [Nocardioides sp. KC13]
MADVYVVDTGVFIRWFVDQDGFEHAREIQEALVNETITAATVDFARVEVAGVLRKKGLLANLLSEDEFAAAVRIIDDLGVTVHQTGADRLERAARLAASKMLRMYDALFVSLADELDLPLLTSDAKLARAADGIIQVDVLRGISLPA